MKTKNFLLLGSLGLASYIIGKYFMRRLNSTGETFGLLSKKEIEQLYSRVKL